MTLYGESRSAPGTAIREYPSAVLAPVDTVHLFALTAGGVRVMHAAHAPGGGDSPVNGISVRFPGPDGST